jgi:sphingosine kinase
MVDTLQSRRTRDKSILTPNAKLNGNAIDLPLPKHSTNDEGWITFDKPLLYVYAGQGPYVARFVGLQFQAFHDLKVVISFSDYMTFPVSLPDDGFIDVSAQEMVFAQFAVSVSLPNVCFRLVAGRF